MGSFPIVINQWAAIAITVYYGATIAVMYYTRALAHLKARPPLEGGSHGMPGVAASIWPLAQPYASEAHTHFQPSSQTRNPFFVSPLQSMWFASCANSILWFAFLKAMWRATIGKYIAGAITFKVTAKGLQSLKDSALR